MNATYEDSYHYGDDYLEVDLRREVRPFASEYLDEVDEDFDSVSPASLDDFDFMALANASLRYSDWRNDEQ